MTHELCLESSGGIFTHRCAGCPGMTQRPDSAAILDWSLEHLGLASLYDLGFSHHGGWFLRRIIQRKVQESEHSKRTRQKLPDIL